jgi:hypothetical protein
MTARTTMGIRGAGAYVVHRAEDGTRTEYTLMPPADRVEFTEDVLVITGIEGPDVLEHDEVRNCAMDAFLDAYGAR